MAIINQIAFFEASILLIDSFVKISQALFGIWNQTWNLALKLELDFSIPIILIGVYITIKITVLIQNSIPWHWKCFLNNAHWYGKHFYECVPVAFSDHRRQWRPLTTVIGCALWPSSQVAPTDLHLWWHLLITVIGGALRPPSQPVSFDTITGSNLRPISLQHPPTTISSSALQLHWQHLLIQFIITIHILILYLLQTEKLRFLVDSNSVHWNRIKVLNCNLSL